MESEKKPETNQEKVNHRIENIISAKENEEAREKRELEKKLENLDFRRDYYMSELEKIYDRIPAEAYCQLEYEQITDKYNSIIDKMEVAETEEEFKKLIKEFEHYRGKRFSEKTVYTVLLILFLVGLGGLFLYFFLASRI